MEWLNLDGFYRLGRCVACVELLAADEAPGEAEIQEAADFTSEYGNKPELAPAKEAAVELWRKLARAFDKDIQREHGRSGSPKTPHSCAFGSGVSLYVTHHNWCRVFLAHRVTPAMAAGLTDTVWSMAHLLALVLTPKQGVA